MMIEFKLNEEQYSLAKKYIPPCFTEEYECFYDDKNNIIKVNGNHIDEYMSSADEAIIKYGMVNQDYLTELGCKLQFLYDELYYQQ